MQKNWRYYILAAYVIVSVGYIGYRLWQDFVERYSNQAYTQGKADTIAAIVGQASDGSCKPVTVYNNTTQAQLIDVACLTAATPDTTTDPTATTNNNSQ